MRAKLASVLEESEATMVGEPSEATRRMGSPWGGGEGEVGEDDNKGGPVGGGWGDKRHKEGVPKVGNRRRRWHKLLSCLLSMERRSGAQHPSPVPSHPRHSIL